MYEKRASQQRVSAAPVAVYKEFWAAAAQEEKDPQPPIDVIPEELYLEDYVELKNLVDIDADDKMWLKPSAFHTALLEVSEGYQILCKQITRSLGKQGAKPRKVKKN